MLCQRLRSSLFRGILVDGWVTAIWSNRIGNQQHADSKRSMITFYDKLCLEAPIKKTDASGLVDAVGSLKEKHNGLVCSALAMLPGGAANLEVRKRQLDSWLKSPDKPSHVLEIFAPEEAQNVFIVLQLRDIERLTTDFGNQHRRDCAAYMVLYSFSQHPVPEDTIATLHNDLREAMKDSLALKKLPPITSIFTTNKIFKSLEEKAERGEEPTESALIAMDKLKDPKVRGIIIRARQAKEPSTSNIAKSIALEESVVRRVLNRATKEGMLAKEYNVVCDGCARVIARVRDKRIIQQMSKDKVSCSSCARPIRRTSYEEVYTVPTEICELLDGSNWMSLCAERSLRVLGIGANWILREVIDGPNQLDVVANFDGDLVLMELKDNRFSIGHAYPFVGKCSQYRPDVAIVVSTEGIDPDVKEYIGNIGFDTHYVEDINKLDKQLKSIFSERYGIRLAQLVQQISWDSFLSPSLLEGFGLSPRMIRKAYPRVSDMMWGRRFVEPVD